LLKPVILIEKIHLLWGESEFGVLLKILYAALKGAKRYRRASIGVSSPPKWAMNALM
jgi:hypothetical protein